MKQKKLRIIQSILVCFSLNISIIACSKDSFVEIYQGQSPPMNSSDTSMVIRAATPYLSNANVFFHNSIYGDSIDPNLKFYFKGDPKTTTNHVSNFSKGINGLIMNLEDCGIVPSINDFTFKMGDDFNEDNWTDIPNPSSVNIEKSGTHCTVKLIWPDHSILNTWLSLEYGGKKGYLASLSGDVTQDLTNNIGDITPISALFGSFVSGFQSQDVNRDGIVNITDIEVVSGIFGRKLIFRPW